MTQQILILDRIREGFAHVAAHARHVKIAHEKLDEYAATLNALPPEHLFDADHHYLGDAESTAAYVMTLDAINFGSGYKTAMAEEGWPLINGSIYFTVSTRLKEAFEAMGPFSAAKLQGISADECAGLLKLPEAPLSREFAALCARSLNELGAVIARDYEGSFLKFVEAAHGSSDGMVEMLTAKMPMFRDEHAYHGAAIPFNKRAQITVADLQLAMAQLGQEPFKDVQRLTMFPDNAVPHVLRMDGILSYTDALSAKIAAGALLAPGSEEEIEIRACAGHVVELLAARKDLTSMNIDHILWHRSVDDPVYKTQKTHRTRTHNY